MAPYDAARLGVHLHGLAGDAVRERVGDSGLLASDLPDHVAFARRRLAALAERRNSSSSLGFRARDGGSAPGL
jgi:NAD(P)H-hydrate epimerase